MENPQAELIHIKVDRRLGHQWDEWNGKPLPNRGNFDAPPALFLRWSGLALLIAALLVATVTFLLAPRLATLSPALASAAWIMVAVATALTLCWWLAIVISYLFNISLLPPRMAERGLYLRALALTSRVAAWFKRRDPVENAGVKVYNALALRRAGQIGDGEMLLLVPRCLSRETLDGVLTLAGKYQVPVFVATRGQLARRAIRERRPRAVVAVACERDMVTGLHDVAAMLPVLGLTMTLPNGPCKDAALDLVTLERYMRAFVAAPAPDPAVESAAALS